MLSPPDHPREVERLELLRRCGVLDTDADSDFDALVDLAAEIAGVPIALVSLVDEGRQWFKSRHGLAIRETPRALAFCAHAILDADRPLVVPDARADARFAGNPLVGGEPRVVFYAGVPLRVGPDRLPLGTLCVIDHVVRQLDGRVLVQLRLLARQAEQLFDLRLRQRELEVLLAGVARDQGRIGAIVSAIDEGLVVHRADASIASCNPAAERILGLSAEQIQGRTSLDPRWQATRADGSPFPGTEHPAVQSLASGRPVRGVVMGVGLRDGERGWILINAQPIELDGAGKPRGVVSSFTDITALRREEAERHRVESQVDRFFTLSLDLLCIAGADGRLLRLNPAWSRVLGWSEAELLGLLYQEYIHPDDRENSRRELAQLAHHGDFSPGFENRYRCKDGSWRTLSWVAVADGETVLAVGHDVTAERARQAELVRTRDAAEAANRAKGEFLATMSHEIRTPINGVIGLTDVLLDTPLSAEQRDLLGAIRDSGRALMAILNDILDWSRIEAGRLSLESEPVDPHAVLGDVVTVLRPEAVAKGLRLDVSPGPIVSVQGDPGRIRQVLFNLLGNAIKFTSQGGIRVGFAVLPANPARPLGSCQFTVEDTGIGISEDGLEGLFQRFTQGDASTTRRFGGSGLGLAISRQLVSLMGGDLTASSVLGRGSVFTVVLPLATGPLAHPSTSAQPPSPATSQRSLRVLLAEDNLMNQRVAIALLKQAGHAVEVVSNGVEAVAAFRRGGWDVALLDVQMPEMDGMDAARAIRAAETVAPGGHRLPIVAFTASAMPREHAACLAAGMDDVLSKPVTREALRRILARWCP